MNPGGELRNGDAGKDADEQLPGQSIFDPTLVEDGICTLWFATVFFVLKRVEFSIVSNIRPPARVDNDAVRTTARQRRTAARPRRFPQR